MARNYGDEKLGNSNHEEEEEEEEALSLCDLPIDLISKENQSRNEQEAAAKSIETQEDFNFGSWGGSVLTESEMCVADEVFFQGQILPLRLSVSSDSGLNRFRHDGRCNSRSESLDHRCCYSGSGGVSSISSRSSSCRSHISSSSTNSTSTTTTTTNPNNYIKPKVRNPFHTHPSPKPQIRVSSIRHGNAGVGGGRRQKSSIWEFFRVGLVPTPEIELQNLKLRTKNNNSSRSFGTRSNSTNSNNSSTSDDLKLKKQRSKRQRFFDKDGSFFSGCKCSADAIETVSSRIVIIKSKNSGSRNNESESETEVMKEKLLQIKQGKQGMSENHHHHHHHHHHNRTFEWLKELSIEGGGGGGLDNA